jgi:beta-fructofuranosidase
MKMDRRKFLSNSASASVVGLTFQSASSRASVIAPQHELQRDVLRPQFHLLPAANWMNDPDGPIYWNDHYHMFYQYNPNGAFWGDMHWGHAISTDMVHWKHLPLALSPTPGGPDADGCFTGTSLVHEGKVVVLYTGVVAVPLGQATNKGGPQSLRETQCLVTSTDPDLKTWTKLDAPVIAEPPPGMQINGFRDPSPWRQGDWWYMVLGAGVANGGGVVLLYKSKDLHNWEFVHVLAGRNESTEHRFDPYNPWEVWECPEFFALDGKHVLIFSTLSRAYWQSGVLDLQTMQFHPDQAGIVDYGSYYAPKTQLDKSGKRILWGWIQETRPLEQYKAAGWAGLMSLPRVLELGTDGRLKSSIAPEVNTLRGREQKLNITPDEEKNQRQIGAMRIEECCGEIQCAVQRTADPFELILCAAAAHSVPWLTLKYDPHHPQQICVDARPLPLALGDREDLELHLYIDGSVIEVFVNSQVANTKRFYYASSSPQDMCVRWTGKTTNLVSFSVWQLSPISSDRCTS